MTFFFLSGKDVIRCSGIVNNMILTVAPGNALLAANPIPPRATERTQFRMALEPLLTERTQFLATLGPLLTERTQFRTAWASFVTERTQFHRTQTESRDGTNPISWSDNWLRAA